MARKVFFSFHFKRDSWRAGQVRNADLLADEDEYGVIDAAEWEKIEREGNDAIARWIQGQLKSTSITVVLIGAETDGRTWIDYEIAESWKRGNAVVGLYVHNVKDKDGKTDVKGTNPLDRLKLKNGKPLSSVCKTYDWVTDDGRANLGTWVEDAFVEREKIKEELEESQGKPKKASMSVPPILPTAYAAPSSFHPQRSYGSDT